MWLCLIGFALTMLVITKFLPTCTLVFFKGDIDLLIITSVQYIISLRWYLVMLSYINQEQVSICGLKKKKFKEPYENDQIFRFQNFWHEYFARISRRKNSLPTLLEIDTSKVGRQFVHHFVEYLFWRPWNANKLHEQETQCSSPKSPSRRPLWESTVKLAGFS